MVSNFLGMMLCMFVGGIAYGDYIQLLTDDFKPSEGHLARAHVRFWMLFFIVGLFNFLAAGDVYFTILPQPERGMVDVTLLVGATVVMFLTLFMHYRAQAKSTILARRERQQRQG
jgi:hypothetical protein